MKASNLIIGNSRLLAACDFVNLQHQKIIEMNLKGKNAIVTGGGRGLGKAVALLLAKEGVNIGITGRNEENLKSTVEELKGLGIQAFYSIFSMD